MHDNQVKIVSDVTRDNRLDDDLKAIKHSYLADEETVRKAAEAVANQGKSK